MNICKTSRMVLQFITVIGVSLMANAQNAGHSDTTLTSKQAAIIPIAAHTAQGNIEQLKGAIAGGLEAGLTINEIKEVLIQMYAYTGFPRSLNAISTLQAVINERRQKGNSDQWGKEPTHVRIKQSKFEAGKSVQTKLTGTTAIGAPQQFVPLIDTFLKEHLFADIFGRDNLDYQSREIATISALASLNGAEGQLRAHLNVGRNVGLTAQQLQGIASILATQIGSQESNRINTALNNGMSAGNGGPTAVHQGKEPGHAEALFPKGAKITNNNFTGNAWLSYLVQADTTNATQVGNVSFEPSARTNWHLHPGGQVLLVTSGTGYYQEKGSAKRQIKKGEVIKCTPGVPHWHGAGKDEPMVHISITNAGKEGVVWLQPVTDEEYLKW
jgi:quercetin dioxygenase-like cupin family protein/alkylhydroperoxidase/carboxymuconolactone decarboxylase family protein YurZ